MNDLQYKKFFNEKNWKKDLINVTDWINGYLTNMSVNCKNRFTKINHPLVDSGKAIWINNNTICVGFISKNNDLYVSVKKLTIDL